MRVLGILLFLAVPLVSGLLYGQGKNTPDECPPWYTYTTFDRSTFCIDTLRKHAFLVQNGLSCRPCYTQIERVVKDIDSTVNVVILLVEPRRSGVLERRQLSQSLKSFVVTDNFGFMNQSNMDSCLRSMHGTSTEQGNVGTGSPCLIYVNSRGQKAFVPYLDLFPASDSMSVQDDEHIRSVLIPVLSDNRSRR